MFCAGCASYATPGGPAPLAAMSTGDGAGSEALPAALSHPIRVSVVRIQAADYASASSERIATGAFSVVMAPELSSQPVRTIAQWPLVTEAAVLRAALLPAEVLSLDDLRLAAAKSLADVLLVYTLDTRFEAGGRSFNPLDEISLGAAPTPDACVTTAASALLLEVRTGRRYGTAQSSARVADLGEAWRSAAALDGKRIEAERQAFAALLSESQTVWSRISGQSEFSHVSVPWATAVH